MGGNGQHGAELRDEFFLCRIHVKIMDTGQGELLALNLAPAVRVSVTATHGTPDRRFGPYY